MDPQLKNKFDTTLIATRDILAAANSCKQFNASKYTDDLKAWKFDIDDLNEATTHTTVVYDSITNDRKSKPLKDHVTDWTRQLTAAHALVNSKLLDFCIKYGVFNPLDTCVIMNEIRQDVVRRVVEQNYKNLDSRLKMFLMLQFDFFESIQESHKAVQALVVNMLGTKIFPKTDLQIALNFQKSPEDVTILTLMMEIPLEPYTNASILHLLFYFAFSSHHKSSFYENCNNLFDLLFKAGINPNSLDKLQVTPLCHAMHYYSQVEETHKPRYFKLIRQLVEYHATDINSSVGILARDEDPNRTLPWLPLPIPLPRFATPLHLAIATNCVELVKLLCTQRRINLKSVKRGVVTPRELAHDCYKMILTVDSKDPAADRAMKILQLIITTEQQQSDLATAELMESLTVSDEGASRQRFVPVLPVTIKTIKAIKISEKGNDSGSRIFLNVFGDFIEIPPPPTEEIITATIEPGKSSVDWKWNGNPIFIKMKAKTNTGSLKRANPTRYYDITFITDEHDPLYVQAVQSYNDSLTPDSPKRLAAPTARTAGAAASGAKTRLTFEQPKTTFTLYAAVLKNSTVHVPIYTGSLDTDVEMAKVETALGALGLVDSSSSEELAYLKANMLKSLQTRETNAQYKTLKFSSLFKVKPGDEEDVRNNVRTTLNELLHITIPEEYHKNFFKINVTQKGKRFLMLEINKTTYVILGTMSHINKRPANIYRIKEVHQDIHLDVNDENVIDISTGYRATFIDLTL